MAHIQDRGKGTGRRRWKARYVDPEGQERSRSFDRKVDAETFLATVGADVARGQWLDPDLGRRTFGEVAKAWRAMQVHRPTTAAALETHLTRHILPTFGERTIASIRPSEVQAWVKGRGDKLAPSTVEVVYRWLAAVFRSAVDDGIIARSPCRGIKLPKVERAKVVPPTTEQVRAVVEAMPKRYQAVVTLAAGTGLRQGEAFGLTLDRVDFLRRRVEVEQQLVKVQGSAPGLAPPKTEASRRTVPLPQVVAEALARHLEDFEPGPWGLIFTNRHGEPINRTRFSDVWRQAVKDAGHEGLVRFHDLRHYYASLLIRRGESVKVVQARLGHASGAETLDTYSHLWPDSEDTTREAVDAELGDSETAPGRPEDGPVTRMGRSEG